MNNALQIREAFERVHGVTHPRHTDVIRAMSLMRKTGVSPQVAVTQVLVGGAR